MNKRRKKALDKMVAANNVAPTPDGKYGLLDTKDQLWMGTGNEPLRYNDEKMAHIAARVLNVRMQWSPTRIIAVEFSTCGKKRDVKIEV